MVQQRLVVTNLLSMDASTASEHAEKGKASEISEHAKLQKLLAESSYTFCYEDGAFQCWHCLKRCRPQDLKQVHSTESDCEGLVLKSFDRVL